MTLLSPLPEWLKPGRAHVVLTVSSQTADEPRPAKPKLTATPEMIAQRMAALEAVRELNPFREIADPVTWQRKTREDVALPGRE